MRHFLVSRQPVRCVSCCSSVAQSCLILCDQASLSCTVSWSLLKFMSIELVMLSNHLIFCCPLCLLPSIFPSIRVFSSELALHIRRPEYWSFSFSISPSDEYSGLISFRIVWFDSPIDWFELHAQYKKVHKCFTLFL